MTDIRCLRHFSTFSNSDDAREQTKNDHKNARNQAKDLLELGLRSTNANSSRHSAYVVPSKNIFLQQTENAGCQPLEKHICEKVFRMAFPVCAEKTSNQLQDGDKLLVNLENVDAEDQNEGSKDRTQIIQQSQTVDGIDTANADANYSAVFMSVGQTGKIKLTCAVSKEKPANYPLASEFSLGKPPMVEGKIVRYVLVEVREIEAKDKNVDETTAIAEMYRRPNIEKIEEHIYKRIRNYRMVFVAQKIRGDTLATQASRDAGIRSTKVDFSLRWRFTINFDNGCEHNGSVKYLFPFVFNHINSTIKDHLSLENIVYRPFERYENGRYEFRTPHTVIAGFKRDDMWYEFLKGASKFGELRISAPKLQTFFEEDSRALKVASLFFGEVEMDAEFCKMVVKTSIVESQNTKIPLETLMAQIKNGIENSYGGLPVAKAVEVLGNSKKISPESVAQIYIYGSLVARKLLPLVEEEAVAELPRDKIRNEMQFEADEDNEWEALDRGPSHVEKVISLMREQGFSTFNFKARQVESLNDISVDFASLEESVNMFLDNADARKVGFVNKFEKAIFKAISQMKLPESAIETWCTVYDRQIPYDMYTANMVMSIYIRQQGSEDTLSINCNSSPASIVDKNSLIEFRTGLVRKYSEFVLYNGKFGTANKAGNYYPVAVEHVKVRTAISGLANTQLIPKPGTQITMYVKTRPYAHEPERATALAGILNFQWKGEGCIIFCNPTSVTPVRKNVFDEVKYVIGKDPRMTPSWYTVMFASATEETIRLKKLAMVEETGAKISRAKTTAKAEKLFEDTKIEMVADSDNAQFAREVENFTLEEVEQLHSVLTRKYAVESEDSKAVQDSKFARLKSRKEDILMTSIVELIDKFKNARNFGIGTANFNSAVHFARKLGLLNMSGKEIEFEEAMETVQSKLRLHLVKQNSWEAGTEANTQVFQILVKEIVTRAKNAHESAAIERAKQKEDVKKSNDEVFDSRPVVKVSLLLQLFSSLIEHRAVSEPLKISDANRAASLEERMRTADKMSYVDASAIKELAIQNAALGTYTESSLKALPIGLKSTGEALFKVFFPARPGVPALVKTATGSKPMTQNFAYGYVTAVVRFFASAIEDPTTIDILCRLIHMAAHKQELPEIELWSPSADKPLHWFYEWVTDPNQTYVPISKLDWSNSKFQHSCRMVFEKIIPNRQASSILIVDLGVSNSEGKLVNLTTLDPKNCIPLGPMRTSYFSRDPNLDLNVTLLPSFMHTIANTLLDNQIPKLEKYSKAALDELRESTYIASRLAFFDRLFKSGYVSSTKERNREVCKQVAANLKEKLGRSIDLPHVMEMYDFVSAWKAPEGDLPMKKTKIASFSKMLNDINKIADHIADSGCLANLASEWSIKLNHFRRTVREHLAFEPIELPVVGDKLVAILKDSEFRFAHQYPTEKLISTFDIEKTGLLPAEAHREFVKRVKAQIKLTEETLLKIQNLEFSLGFGRVIEGLERAIVTMSAQITSQDRSRSVPDIDAINDLILEGSTIETITIGNYLDLERYVTDLDVAIKYIEAYRTSEYGRANLLAAYARAGKNAALLNASVGEFEIPDVKEIERALSLDKMLEAGKCKAEVELGDLRDFLNAISEIEMKILTEENAAMLQKCEGLLGEIKVTKEMIGAQIEALGEEFGHFYDEINLNHYGSNFFEVQSKMLFDAVFHNSIVRNDKVLLDLMNSENGMSKVQRASAINADLEKLGLQKIKWTGKDGRGYLEPRDFMVDFGVEFAKMAPLRDAKALCGAIEIAIYTSNTYTRAPDTKFYQRVHSGGSQHSSDDHVGSENYGVDDFQDGDKLILEDIVTVQTFNFALPQVWFTFP